jgi:hypothetical protein
VAALPAQRVARVHGRIEKVVDLFGGFVAVHQDFVQDDLALGFELIGAQGRGPDDLGEDVEAEVDRTGQQPHVKGGVLLGRERVHIPAHGVDELGYLAGAALLGALE